MKKSLILLLLVITIVGGVLRFYKNTENPSSLNIDEVSIGYNAYSILKTGKDEHGVFMPISFESVGDYKPPVLIYLTVPSIALFGLNEFGVRFPNALISTLSIFLFFFLFKELSGNTKTAILASVLLAISPWHIYYSRYAVEALIALFFLGLGVLGLLRIFKERIWIILSPLFLVLSMYTYHAERLFVPLFVFAFLIIHKSVVRTNYKKILIFLITFGILVLPLFISTIFGSDSTRAQTTFITRDIEYIRTVLVEEKNIPTTFSPVLKFLDNDTFLLFFYFLRKYLNYFEPSFLFYSGLGMTMSDTYGVGIVYLFEAIFILAGIYVFVVNKNFNQSKLKNIPLVVTWILLGIFPAALTQNEQHSLRTLLILPAVILLSSVGGIFLLEHVQKIKKFFLRNLIFTIFAGFVIFNLVYVYLMFAVHFPIQKGEAFMEGSKEVVELALKDKDKYQEIIFDPVRGVDGPYIVSIPHMYVLFYSKFDPALYQSIPKRVGNESYGFDKFTIRRIDWRSDQDKNNVLLVGTPWSLPEKDIKPEQIIGRIYLANGKLAFLVVSPK